MTSWVTFPVVAVINSGKTKNVDLFTVTLLFVFSWETRLLSLSLAGDFFTDLKQNMCGSFFSFSRRSVQSQSTVHAFRVKYPQEHGISFTFVTFRNNAFHVTPQLFARAHTHREKNISDCKSFFFFDSVSRIFFFIRWARMYLGVRPFLPAQTLSNKT